MGQFVCNKEGERSEKHLNRNGRKREAKAITRTKYNARLRIHLNYKSRKWRVGCFEPIHNHELTPASMVHLLPAYRGLSVADKAQVDGLHLYGVRTCHIMGLIMGQKGGYSDLGFCKKDLYNHIDKVNRAKTEDGDAFAALSYLQAKLCAWHLHQNACENVKNPKFLEDFKNLIYGSFTRENFEDEWNKVVEKHGVRENRWVRKVYELKRMWATAYLRDNFFGGIRTTSICEGINSFIKSAMKHKQVESIPASLICKRWTKLAKVDHISDVYAEEAEQMERQEGIDLNSVDVSRVVRDPTVVKTKGAPQMNKKRTKKRRCSYCKRPGHTVRTCTKYATRDQLGTVIEEESSVETDQDSRDESVSVNPQFSRDVRNVSVSGDHNRASDKGQGQSKKKRKFNENVKHNEAPVKLTQESVNEMRSSDVNKAHKSGMSLSCAQNFKSDFNVNQMSTPSLP
ncbi:Zinc finger, CCHC-type superfamily [Sesbania bispinosa]|nr:Zinc finger, CCHC-type superfamily [Sesbania bispinosa]